MTLGQIIFPATGSWAQPILSDYSGSFTIQDRLATVIACPSGSCCSASMICMGIPKEHTIEIPRDKCDPTWISNFDTNNNGPVYVYVGNSYEIYMLYSRYYKK